MGRNLKKVGLASAAGAGLAAVLAACWVAGPRILSGFSWLSWFILSMGIMLSCISLVAMAGKKWTCPMRPLSRMDFSGDRGDGGISNMLVIGSGSQEERPGQAALINHEIRNHLCTLKGSARLLRQHIAGNDYAEIIDRIDRVVERLESFASGTGKTETGHAAKTAPLRMEDVARTVVKTHFSQARTQFRWGVGMGTETVLWNDPVRLEHVFHNLYANAVEAGALNVTTSLHVFGSRLVVGVEDDGSGCHAADLGRIFEPFFSTKQGPARRGLGMVIVRSIVESLGGTIKVRSKNHLGRRSQGLAFRLEFPVTTGGDFPGRPSAKTPLGNKASPGDSLSRDWLLSLPEPI